MSQIDEIKKLSFPNFRNTKAVPRGCEFWERSLLLKASRILEIENIELLPAIDPVLFVECVLWCGYQPIIDSKKWGAIAPSAGIKTSFSLSEFDFNGHPTKAVLANPKLLLAKEYSIEPYCRLTDFPNIKNDKCAVVFCTTQDSVIADSYPVGLRPFIQRNARFLADIDSSTTIAMINGRKSSILKVNNARTEETVKLVNRLVEEGKVESAIVRSDDPIFEKVEAPFASVQTNDLTQLHELKFNVQKEFWAELGVNKLEDKKERLITDEAKSDESSTISIDNILRTMQNGLDVASVLFEKQLQGNRLKVKLNEKLVEKIKEEYFKEEGQSDETDN